MWYINENLSLTHDGGDDYTRDLAICRECGGLGRLYNVSMDEIEISDERQCPHCHGTGYVW